MKKDDHNLVFTPCKHDPVPLDWRNSSSPLGSAIRSDVRAIRSEPVGAGRTTTKRV